jgi:hypothetical protein
METHIIIIGIFAVIVLVLVYMIISKLAGKKTSVSITSFTVLERFKEMGELVVFAAYTKEVTAVGGDEKLYVWTGKKMLLISSFEIEYRYNMAEVKIVKKNDTNSYIVTMPPVIPKVNVPEPAFPYHEEGNKIFGLPIGGFSSKEKYDMTVIAQKKAGADALELFKRLSGQIENSAERSLRSIFKAVEITNIEFEFQVNKSISEQINEGIKQIKVD